MTTLLQTLSSDVPVFSLEVLFLVAGVVILILAIVAYLRAVALGDSVIEWLQDAEEPTPPRPWSLPAAKGFEKRYVIRFGTRGVVFGVKRVPHNVVRFERKRVQW